MFSYCLQFTNKSFKITVTLLNKTVREHMVIYQAKLFLTTKMKHACIDLVTCVDSIKVSQEFV